MTPTMYISGASASSSASVSTVARPRTIMLSAARMQNSPNSRLKKIVRGDIACSIQFANAQGIDFASMMS
jgi:hypothetical protein